ncbi:unnamed protein product [Linum tenue]|uniref:Uncharacterized protein n=1 Tax=Linum tenue TaxID=586396 RepID=A0AAV0LQH8_9ROSI|nr:unnamed protein product [Linum tenue]
MSAGLSKCAKIRHIVRLRQLLRRWRNKARVSSATNKQIPSDVPSGHVAVCVGSSCRRFLLTQAEEEFGFSNNQGPLTIPCDESVFEEAIRYIAKSDGSNRFANLEDLKLKCHSIRRKPSDLWTESRPLLAEKPTIW